MDAGKNGPGKDGPGKKGPAKTVRRQKSPFVTGMCGPFDPIPLTKYSSY